MKYYKNGSDQVFAYEADGSQDEFIPDDQILISEKVAQELIKKMLDANYGEFVPDSVSRFQMISILKITKFEDGTPMFQVVDEYIKSLHDETDENIILKTAWETAMSFNRDSLPVLTAQRLLGLTDAQADEIFKKAYEITT
ncbi:hypothetical protein [uncultured Gilliamella sp.]|uniref:hypothetical protein n=1 Tax=uncultured Gilliamella sp. TaxID=1193505 RepID=UPI0025FA49E2|nr:hypothetical protein [uncultured Gilliamella sp.]